MNKQRQAGHYAPPFLLPERDRYSCCISCCMSAVDPQIAKIQLILRHHGYKGKNGLPLEVDGELGVQTMYAIETLQREKGFPGTTNWGTVAAKTWQAILNL